MQKYACLLIIVVLPAWVRIFGQEKLISFTTYKTWPTLAPICISNDGLYFAYTLSTPADGMVLTIQDINHKTKKDFPRVEAGSFSQDSKHFVFMSGDDSLCIYDLGKDIVHYYPNVTSYKMPGNGDGRWLAYIEKKNVSQLVVYDLWIGNRKTMANVKKFDFNSTGETLWMECKSDSTATLLLTNLKTGRTDTLDKGHRYFNETFNGYGDALVYLSEDSTHQSLCYFKEGIDSVTIASELVLKLGLRFSKNRPLLFNKSENRIYFCVEHLPSGKIRGNNGTLVIRTYKDAFVDFTADLESTPAWAYSDMDDKNHAIISLGGPHNTYLATPFTLQGRDYLLSSEYVLDSSTDHSTIPSVQSNLFVWDVHMRRKIMLDKDAFFEKPTISSDGKFIVWFDRTRGQWYSYNMESGGKISLTTRYRFPSADSPALAGLLFSIPYGLVGWEQGKNVIILQDKYDPWEVDLGGESQPVCLTNGYGRKHGIQLRALRFDNTVAPQFNAGDTIMLCAFNLTTKENGFGILPLKDGGRFVPPKLERRKYYYEFDAGDGEGCQHPFYPLKAKNADRFIVGRMSPTEYPNLYVSEDLQSFKTITNFAPQKEYNWYTAELVHWRMPDGVLGQGIFYKPQDFDAKKKYPIIFYYYEKNTNTVYNFVHPDLSSVNLSITWYVSNGYLVFMPDIEYKLGHPGKSACNSIVSAAEYMAKFPFVDPKHMGLQGHSFGGYETNYVVTHSSLFAAAVSCAGEVDWMGTYGASPDYYEQGQGKMGYPFWKNPAGYLENSPFIHADRVTTPLLIMHNSLDYLVTVNQGQSWFNGLSRLGKQTWWLNYLKEGHTLENEDNRLDFSIRMAQFFDHFLKGKPAPLWMTEDINPGLGLEQ